MIEGNELDVTNINFELQVKRGDKLLCFTLFRNFKELSVSLQPDVRPWLGFGSKCCILNGHVVNIEKPELNFADMWLIPLDRVTYVNNNVSGYGNHN